MNRNWWDGMTYEQWSAENKRRWEEAKRQHEAEKQAKEKPMREVSWAELAEIGGFWFINRTLHLLGYALVREEDEDGNVTRVYPARTKFRGFDREAEEDGFRRVTKHLRDEADELVEDLDYESDHPSQVTDPDALRAMLNRAIGERDAARDLARSFKNGSADLIDVQAAGDWLYEDDEDEDCDDPDSEDMNEPTDDPDSGPLDDPNPQAT